MTVSDLISFEELACAGCANHVIDEEGSDQCHILGVLAASGKCDCISELKEIDKETGCFYRCYMRRPDHEFSVEHWVDMARTEEVEKMLRAIKDSYHFDVIKRLEHGNDHL